MQCHPKTQLPFLGHFPHHEGSSCFLIPKNCGSPEHDSTVGDTHKIQENGWKSKLDTES